MSQDRRSMLRAIVPTGLLSGEFASDECLDDIDVPDGAVLDDGNSESTSVDGEDSELTAQSHGRGLSPVFVLGNGEEVSRREIIHEVTQPTRFSILQHILMHPQQMPAMVELKFMNPEKSTSTLREHIERLSDLGIIDVVPVEKVDRDMPRQYYALTDLGREVLHELGFLNLETTLQDLYSRVKKPDYISEVESRTRPDPTRNVIEN